MKAIISNKNNLLKILLFFILLIIPWSFSDYTDSISAEKITSDLRFYQINTCSISLFEFLSSNLNVLYQDHYKLRFNDYSSIKCFGRITGIDQVGYVFYISVGTNALVNLFLQSSFWLFLISLIRREEEYSFNFLQFFSVSLGSLFLSYGVYSEEKFYSLKIYLLDLTTYKNFIYLSIYFFYVGFFSRAVIGTRRKALIYLLPFLYIFIGLYSGWNIYFLSIFFVIYGIEKLLDSSINRKIFTPLNLIILYWGYQALGDQFYLDPDKIRGFSNTIYNFPSVIFWSYYTVFLFAGVFYFFKDRSLDFDISLFKNNFLISGSVIFVLGYLGSSMPFFNFFNYYLFGQTKYGTDNQDIFGVNFWGEKVAWRGFFPSAETIGEFFAIALLIFFLQSIKNFSTKDLSYFLVPFSIAGLYASNNKAATLALFLCILLKINKEFNIKKTYKAVSIVGMLVLLIFLIRPENLLLGLDFTSKNMINSGYTYGIDPDRSNAINYIFNLKNFSPIYWVLLLIGQIAFLINRSELWGIFLARYSPEMGEVIFGTGPFTLSNHYNEVLVSKTRVGSGTDLGFLLPHSSILLVLVFFGLFGVILFISIVYKRLKYLKLKNYDHFLVCLFIVINLLKSDSILYFPSLLMYFIFIFVFTRKKVITS